MEKGDTLVLMTASLSIVAIVLVTVTLGQPGTPEDTLLGFISARGAEKVAENAVVMTLAVQGASPAMSDNDQSVALEAVLKRGTVSQVSFSATNGGCSVPLGVSAASPYRTTTSAAALFASCGAGQYTLLAEGLHQSGAVATATGSFDVQQAVQPITLEWDQPQEDGDPVVGTYDVIIFTTGAVARATLRAQSVFVDDNGNRAMLVHDVQTESDEGYFEFSWDTRNDPGPQPAGTAYEPYGQRTISVLIEDASGQQLSESLTVDVRAPVVS